MQNVLVLCRARTLDLAGIPALLLHGPNGSLSRKKAQGEALWQHTFINLFTLGPANLFHWKVCQSRDGSLC